MLGVECCDDGDGAIQYERELVTTVPFFGNDVMGLHFGKLQFRMSDNFREVVAAHTLKQGQAQEYVKGGKHVLMRNEDPPQPSLSREGA